MAGWQDTGRTAEALEARQGDCEAKGTTRIEGGRDQRDRVFILAGRRCRRRRRHRLRLRCQRLFGAPP